MVQYQYIILLNLCIQCSYLKEFVKRFEPRSHFISRLSMIVQVNVVLNRTVVVNSD